MIDQPTRTRQLIARAEEVHERSRRLIAETREVVEQNRKTLAESCLARIDRILSPPGVDPNDDPVAPVVARADGILSSIEELFEDTRDALAACESGLYD